MDAEGVAFCGINSRLAEYFDGKCYHYVNDFYSDATLVKRVVKYLDRYFPNKEKNVRCFRESDLHDIREAAIRVIKNGEAVLYSEIDPKQNVLWEKMDPQDQAKIASQNQNIGIKLRSSVFQVELDDPVQGPIYVKLPEAQNVVLFYPAGKPTTVWANVCDDSILEITHAVRERGHANFSCQEIALHLAQGSIPPQFIHLDIHAYQVAGLDPFRLSSHMPNHIILDTIWEQMTHPTWRKTINDMGFLCEPRKPISIDEINNKLTKLIVEEKNDQKRVEYLRVFFNAAETLDLLRFARFINPGEGWDWCAIQDFISSALDGPGHVLNETPILSDHEAVNMSALVTCLGNIEFTTNSINQLIIEFATTIGIHVQKVDRFLMFGCFGRKLPFAHIYQAMCELGKDESIKRLRIAEKLVVPNYSMR
jgi:hypothetical protein